MIHPSVTIFGFGRVGKAMYKSFRAADYNISSVYSRSEQEVEEYLGALPSSNDQLGELVVFCISDDHLLKVIKEVASLNMIGKDQVVVHCSGSHTSDIFKPLWGSGASYASWHPMKAIGDQTVSFKKTWFDAEGDEKAMHLLHEVSKDLGIPLLPIQAKSKPFLHAAAVIASNYLVTLFRLAEDVADAGDVKNPQVTAALISLVHSTLSNIEEKGTQGALTGPIERGDLGTVKKHLELLEDYPQLAHIYKELASATIPMAQNLEADKREELKKLVQ